MTQTIKIVNGDWLFSSATGRPILIGDKDKLTQDVRENLDTQTQANGTGANLDLVVGMVGDLFSIRATISRYINESFASLRAVQDRIQRFDRTPGERISRVARVVVAPMRDSNTGQISMTTFGIRTDVLSIAGGEPTTVTNTLVR